MFKPAGNIKVLELTTGSKRRSMHLGDLKVIVDSATGKRFCVWCAQNPLRSRSQRYCSEICSNSTMAWFYPQSEWGLTVLLLRQDWKCTVCSYDWRPEAQAVHDKMYRDYPYDSHGLGTRFDWGLVRRLKAKVDPSRKPEVDHIVPIYKGGTSLGLDNHQAICNCCHKAKTSIDLSGKRKKA